MIVFMLMGHPDYVEDYQKENFLDSQYTRTVAVGVMVLYRYNSRSCVTFTGGIRHVVRLMWIAIHMDKQVYKLSTWIR